MNQKIRSHVEGLFENAPHSKRAFDLKEELITNLEDKYNDLVKEGKSDAEAYTSVIASIGDIDELLHSLKEENPANAHYQEQARKKTALVVSICVGIYILALLTIGVLDELALPDFVTISAFFTLAGTATCILIYHFMSQPKYLKTDDTLVEEFKEWKSSKSKNTEIKNSITTILWLLIVTVYFIISFVFVAWAYSWVIFLVGAAISQIINLIFKLQD